MPNIIPPRFFADTSFTGDLKNFLGLTREQMHVLAELAESEPSEPTKEDTKLLDVLPLVTFLYELARRENITSQAMVDEMHAIGEKLGVTLTEEQLAELRKLFDPKPSRDQKDSIESSKGCVLPTLSTVSIAQELRNVSNIRSKESLGVIPVIILGLQISYPNGDDRSISIEMNEELLRRLCESLSTAADEIKKLKEQASGSLKVL
jgi:hypothetical protein